MLTIEDGTGVSGANSYASIEDADLFFELRGLGVDGDLAALLMQAMDVLNGLHYCGQKTDRAQALPFPRSGVADADGIEYLDTEIPACLIRAQFWLARYINDGHSPGSVSTADLPLKRQMVGPIEREFAVSDVDPTQLKQVTIDQLPLVFNELRHLIKDAGALSGDSALSGSRRVRNGRIARA